MSDSPNSVRLGVRTEKQPVLFLFSDDGKRKRVDVPVEKVITTLNNLPEERVKDIERSYLAELAYQGPGKMSKEDLFRASLTIWLIHWSEAVKPYNTLETMKSNLDGISVSIREHNSMLAGISRTKVKETFFQNYTDEEMDMLQFSFFVTQSITSNALTPRKELNWSYNSSVHTNKNDESVEAKTLALHILRELPDEQRQNETLENVTAKLRELQKNETTEMMEWISSHLAEAQQRLDDFDDQLPPEYWDKWITFYQSQIDDPKNPPEVQTYYMEGLAKLMLEKIGVEMRKLSPQKDTQPPESMEELLAQINSIRSEIEEKLGISPKTDS